MGVFCILDSLQMLTLTLVRRLDGAGPEHSSSRIERMLQVRTDCHEAQIISLTSAYIA